MAKRRQPRSADPPRPAGPSRAVGHRAKIWLATISTVVGVATGMFTLRDQVFPSEAGSAGAMSTSAYEEHVGRICDEVNANDHLRAHEDSKLRVGLPRAQTTIDQRNLLLDAARRTIARDGQTLASFTGLAAPKAVASVRHDTAAAWNRNLARVRDYALRLDGAGTRAQLVAVLVHLSTLRPLLAADHVTVAAGLERLGAAECDLQPQRVTRTFHVRAAQAARSAARPSADRRAPGHRRGNVPCADPGHAAGPGPQRRRRRRPRLDPPRPGRSRADQARTRRRPRTPPAHAQTRPAPAAARVAPVVPAARAAGPARRPRLRARGPAPRARGSSPTGRRAG